MCSLKTSPYIVSWLCWYDTWNYFYLGRGRLKDWRGKGLHASYALVFFFLRWRVSFWSSTLVNISDQSENTVCPICRDYTDSHTIHRLVMVFFNIILTNFPAYQGIFSSCLFLTTGLSSSMELTRGSSRTTTHTHTHAHTQINAVNTVKVTRLRKAALLVVGRFISWTGCKVRH